MRQTRREEAVSETNFPAKTECKRKSPVSCDDKVAHLQIGRKELRYLRVPKISAALQPDKSTQRRNDFGEGREDKMRASEVIWCLVKDSLEALKKGRRDRRHLPRGLSVANISSHFINQRAPQIFLQPEISIEATCWRRRGGWLCFLIGSPPTDPPKH